MAKERKTRSEILRRGDIDLKSSGSREENRALDLSIVYDALSSTLSGVIITDIEGRIKYANPAFISMFEYKDKYDIIGKFAADIFAASRIRKFTDIEFIIDKGEGEAQEFNVYRKDGSIFPVEVSTSIVSEENGNILGKMASFIDISERKEKEEENKRLSSELLKSQEMERQRVAQDLHDGIAQTILAAKLNFIAYQKDPEKYKDRYKIGLQFIDKASQELREICDDLYPSILEDHGLENTIRWYSKNYLELSNISTDIVIELNEKLSHDLEVNLYRIIKEVFSNIVKHSHADKVMLEMIQREGAITLIVEDNGIGFSTEETGAKGKGFGLSNIHQRVRDLGGLINIESSSGKGTKITIEIIEGK
jgi:PAS domain S-box-containing protein